MRTTRSFHRTLLACLLFLSTLFLGTVDAAAASDQRVVAIGDIHGELAGIVQILTSAGLMDENRQWIGGETTLVQTGDFLDRGKDVRPVMDLLISLQKQAKKAGGKMIVLTGNHEQLNLAGELRPEYVTAEICAAFANDNSEQTRAEAYREMGRLAR